MNAISIRTYSSKDAGSCNGCTRYTTADGKAEHEVVEIVAGYVAIRLCWQCFAELDEQLEQIRQGAERHNGTA